MFLLLEQSSRNFLLLQSAENMGSLRFLRRNKIRDSFFFSFCFFFGNRDCSNLDKHMAIFEHDPDVVRWGLHHLLDVCSPGNSGSPQTITGYDKDLLSG